MIVIASPPLPGPSSGVRGRRADRRGEQSGEAPPGGAKKSSGGIGIAFEPMRYGTGEAVPRENGIVALRGRRSGV